MLVRGVYSPRHDACVALLLDWLRARYSAPDWLVFDDRDDGSHYAWPEEILGPHGQARSDIVVVSTPS